MVFCEHPSSGHAHRTCERSWSLACGPKVTIVKVKIKDSRIRVDEVKDLLAQTLKREVR